MKDLAAYYRSEIERKGFLYNLTEGRSMRPLIWGGQHAVAVDRLDGEPKVGDVLLFTLTMPDGAVRVVEHRLVEVRGDGAERVYVMRGDNNLGCEEVRRADIIGRVAEVHLITGWRPWHAIWARKFSTAGRVHRVYTRLWLASWPARRLLMLARGYAAAVGRLRRPAR
ncbi:MAG: S24/S26 family peptidase [Muribaculaceae bacterium]|nr:S24/S26 family peptidase [Muribaculaceae bacterium]